MTNYLKTLTSQGVIKRENEKTWTMVRNEVTHGRLVAPWTTEEDDQNIQNLMDLVRSLSHLYIDTEVNKLDF